MLKARENLKKVITSSDRRKKEVFVERKKSNNVIITKNRLTPEEKEYNEIIGDVNKSIDTLRGSIPIVLQIFR